MNVRPQYLAHTSPKGIEDGSGGKILRIVVHIVGRCSCVQSEDGTRNDRLRG